jgi:predicted permease
MSGIRFAFRTLLRDPGFFIVAVLIIGLGIGANTAIFSVVNPLLLRPLPFADAERLVWIANTSDGIGLSGVTSRTSNLRDYQRLSRSFTELTGYMAFFDYVSYTLTGEGEPSRLVGVGVEQSFLDVLGVQPELGRSFVDEECVWNAPGAVMLTHGFWSRRFGADPAVVGRTITLNDEPATVVGVLPASFDFASVFAPGARIDFMSPFPICDETDNWGNTMAIIGRLAPGVSIEQAQAELDLIINQLQEAEPDRWGLGAAATGLQEQITGRFRPALTVLACAVGLVLLIACANLSNLLLVRAASRRKEIAVRSALGAGRTSLIRQMLIESLALSASGAALGLFIAYGATRLVAGTNAFSIPLLQTVAVDTNALLFTIVVAFATGLLFGLAPAIQVSRVQEHEVLNDANRGSTEGRGRTWIHEVLVISEVALACVLLVGVGLLLRSFMRVMDVDLGFQPASTAAWRVETGQRYPDHSERKTFYERMVREVETVPGIESVGLTDTLPLGRNRAWGVGAKGEVYGDGERPAGFPRMVDSGYLETMQIPLIAGRGFTPHDTSDSENVMIINEAMARSLWPDQDAIGQTAVFPGGSEWRVVGVVANVRHSSLEEEAGLEMYMPITQQTDWNALELAVRSSLPPESMAAAVKAAAARIDPIVPLGELTTLEQMVDRSVSPRRFILLLIGAFSLTALLLAAIGIYGVISYAVSRQAQEIGIRMALGATAIQVQLRIVLKTLLLTSLGMVAGAAAAFVMTRLMVSLLYDVSPTDSVTFAAMMLVITVIAGLAGYLPSRRASRIEPMSVLRST